MSIKDYNINPDLNTSISGINIAEQCFASNINNAIRQLMADLADSISNPASSVWLVATKNLSDLTDIAAARINLGLGNSAVYNIGTSGYNVPLMASNNTWAWQHFAGFSVTDDNYYFQVDTNQHAVMNVDSGDLFWYDRPNNGFNWTINNATAMWLTDTYGLGLAKPPDPAL